MNKRGYGMIDVIIGINLLILMSLVCYRVMFFNQKSLAYMEVMDKFNSVSSFEVTNIINKANLKMDIYENEDFEITRSKEYFGTENGKIFYITKVVIKNEKYNMEKEYEIIERQ